MKKPKPGKIRAPQGAEDATGMHPRGLVGAKASATAGTGKIPVDERQLQQLGSDGQRIPHAQQPKPKLKMASSLPAAQEASKAVKGMRPVDPADPTNPSVQGPSRQSGTHANENQASSTITERKGNVASLPGDRSAFTSLREGLLVHHPSDAHTGEMVMAADKDGKLMDAYLLHVDTEKDTYLIKFSHR